MVSIHQTSKFNRRLDFFSSVVDTDCNFFLNRGFHHPDKIGLDSPQHFMLEFIERPEITNVQNG